MSVSVNHRTPSMASARISSFERGLLTKLLSSANSMNGRGQTAFIAWISAITFAIGLSLYLRVSVMELAQNSHRHGQPRCV